MESRTFWQRIKSPVVLAGILAQIVLVVAVFNQDYSLMIKGIGTAIIEGLTLVGLLNNPSDPTNW